MNTENKASDTLQILNPFTAGNTLLYDWRFDYAMILPLHVLEAFLDILKECFLATGNSVHEHIWCLQVL